MGSHQSKKDQPKKESERSVRTRKHHHSASFPLFDQLPIDIQRYTFNNVLSVVVYF